MSKLRLITSAGFLGLSLSSCVSRDAGYQDVRKLVGQRTGADARWNHIDGSRRATDTTRWLLSRPLSAESAVQLALLNNRGLQAAFEELGVARSNLVAALALPNPEVEAGLKYDTELGGDPDII